MKGKFIWEMSPEETQDMMKRSSEESQIYNGALKMLILGLMEKNCWGGLLVFYVIIPIHVSKEVLVSSHDMGPGSKPASLKLCINN